MLKFDNFTATLILREIKLWRVQTVQKCHFWQFWKFQTLIFSRFEPLSSPNLPNFQVQRVGWKTSLLRISRQNKWAPLAIIISLITLCLFLCFYFFDRCYLVQVCHKLTTYETPKKKGKCYSFMIISYTQNSVKFLYQLRKSRSIEKRFQIKGGFV